MTPSDPVAMDEVSEAKGADRMLLSEDGRWLALEYALAAELPLVVRLDRQDREPPRAVRGVLAGPPATDGAMYYVAQEGPDMRTVLASNQGRRSHLYRLGEEKPVLSMDGAHGAWPVSARQVALVGGPGMDTAVRLIDVDSGRVTAERALPGSLGFLWDFVVVQGRIHLLFRPADGDNPPQGATGLTLVTLDAVDLHELWRREHIEPAVIFSRPHLGSTASRDRLLVLSSTSDKVATFAADTGIPGPVVQLPTGSGGLKVVPSTRPGTDTFVLWTELGRGGTSRRGWKLLRLRDNAADVVVARPDELPPGAAVWDGSRLHLAPWGPPRLSEPGDWDESVLRYLRLVRAPAR